MRLLATIPLDEWISLGATQYVLEPMLRARYMAVAAREIAPPPPPASERPAGISMSDMTMDEFMDIEDSWSKRRDRV